MPGAPAFTTPPAISHLILEAIWKVCGKGARINYYEDNRDGVNSSWRYKRVYTHREVNEKGVQKPSRKGYKSSRSTPTRSSTGAHVFFGELEVERITNCGTYEAHDSYGET